MRRSTRPLTGSNDYGQERDVYGLRQGKFRMAIRFLTALATTPTFIVLAVFGVASLASAQDRGNCIPIPDIKPPIPTTRPEVWGPPTPDARYAGTVTLLVVISDSGYVCDAKVIDGANENIANEAQEKMKGGHYGLAQKNEPASPQVAMVQIGYWVNSKGKFTLDRTHTTSNVRSEPRPPKESR